MTKRSCDHWLKDFVSWMSPRIQVAESYIIWSGLYMLAAAIRRKVWIPREGLLGSWECYPNLYLTFVAPPGYGKTTTIRLAEELFDDNPTVYKAPICTVAVLAKKISEIPDNAIYIVAEEFGEFMMKMGKDGYEFLTGAFDGKRKMEVETISRGIEFSNQPSVNLATGTTPTWIAENMPESVIGGGYAARVIFLYEDEFRFEQMYYPDVDFTELDILKSKLAADLYYISTELSGPFGIEKEAQEYVEAWLKTNKPYSKPPKLQGYFTRKKVHLHKVAMLYHLSYSDDKILTKHDFEMAFSFLQLSERNLHTVFSHIGKNRYTVDTRSILAHIIQNGQVSKQEILSQFDSVGDVQQIEKLLSHLNLAGKIKMVNGKYEPIISI